MNPRTPAPSPRPGRLQPGRGARRHRRAGQPRRRPGNEGGFTLVELLVVVAIVGILAAIALPTYLSQRTRAQDTAAQTELVTAMQAAEQYRLDNTSYPDRLAQVTDIQPAVDWRESRVANTPMNQDADAGQVFFERESAADVWVSGIRSESARCFYLYARPNGGGRGVFRLRRDGCGDPWGFRTTTSTTW